MDYSKMTVKALRALLVERDCEAPAKANKSELVRLLESLDDSEPAAVEAALEELPPEPGPQPKALWATVSDEVSLGLTRSLPRTTWLRLTLCVACSTVRSALCDAVGWFELSVLSTARSRTRASVKNGCNRGLRHPVARWTVLRIARGDHS